MSNLPLTCVTTAIPSTSTEAQVAVLTKYNNDHLSTNGLSARTDAA